MMFWGRTRWFLCADSPFLPSPALLLPSNVVSPSKKNKKRLDSRMGFLIHVYDTSNTYTHTQRTQHTHTTYTHTTHIQFAFSTASRAAPADKCCFTFQKKNWYSHGMFVISVVVSNTYTHTKSTQHTHATYTHTTHTQLSFSTASCAAFTDKCCFSFQKTQNHSFIYSHRIIVIYVCIYHTHTYTAHHTHNTHTQLPFSTSSGATSADRCCCTFQKTQNHSIRYSRRIILMYVCITHTHTQHTHTHTSHTHTHITHTQLAFHPIPRCFCRQNLFHLPEHTKL